MKQIYTSLEKILNASAKKHNLLVVHGGMGSNAKVQKPQVHIYGKKEVEILKRKKQKTYIAGIMEHKGYIGFYSMAQYAFPKEFSLSPEMKKMLKGKSCFHVKKLDPDLEKEIREVIETGIRLFKKEGWI